MKERENTRFESELEMFLSSFLHLNRYVFLVLFFSNEKLEINLSKFLEFEATKNKRDIKLNESEILGVQIDILNIVTRQRDEARLNQTDIATTHIASPRQHHVLTP